MTKRNLKASYKGASLFDELVTHSSSEHYVPKSLFSAGEVDAYIPSGYSYNLPAAVLKSASPAVGSVINRLKIYKNGNK
jgi:hypothetical protein